MKLFRLVSLPQGPNCEYTFKHSKHVTYFQVLKGVPDRPEVALVKLREIKCKLEKKSNVQDRNKNTVAVKDVVRIVEGPCKVRFPFQILIWIIS